MFGHTLDNVISVLSPTWAARRAAHRNAFNHLKNSSGEHNSMKKMLSGNKGGYQAGHLDRLKGRRTPGGIHENDIDRNQIEVLRWRSWNLFRNCPQAKKICRTLGAKVIGQGLVPQSQAVTLDGKPYAAFRKRAREVWDEFCKECDFRGRPGNGGQSFAGMAKTTLRGASLSGGVLYRFHRLDAAEQKRLGLAIPLQVQLIHVDRLDKQKHGDGYFYGLKVDKQGRVEGFHVNRGGTDTDADTPAVYVPLAEMKHVLLEDDIDQLLGAPWFGAALLTMDDRRGLEHNELTASELGSCIVAGYRLSNGQNKFGLNGPGAAEGPTELCDADGNPVTHMQPGMFVNLGASGSLEMINPGRPNSNLEGFINHLVRSEAVAVPGVKSSTLTGDYRQSSFSSERSADNDIWPEIEELQKWMGESFCQPIYEECIKAAVVAGKFNDVEGFTTVDFNKRLKEFLYTNWQGPVARSINPKDDALAAKARVQNATSSPQREASKAGADWQEIAQEVAEFIAYCKTLKLPDAYWQQALGLPVAASGVAATEKPPVGETVERDEDELSEQEADDEMAANVARGRFIGLNAVGQRSTPAGFAL